MERYVFLSLLDRRVPVTTRLVHMIQTDFSLCCLIGGYYGRYGEIQRRLDLKTALDPFLRVSAWCAANGYLPAVSLQRRSAS